MTNTPLEAMKKTLALSQGNPGAVALLAHFINVSERNKNAFKVFDSLEKHAIQGHVIYFLHTQVCSRTVQRFALFLQALEEDLIQNDIVQAVKGLQTVVLDWDHLGDTLEAKGVQPWLTNMEARNPSNSSFGILSP